MNTAVLLAGLLAAGPAVPANVVAEGETAYAWVQADSPIERIEVEWGGAAGRVVDLAASEDALSWAPVRFRAATGGVEAEPFAARAVRVVADAPVAGLRLFAPGGPLVVRVSDLRVEAGEYEATVRYRTSYPVPTEILYGFDPEHLQPLGAHSAERRREHSVTLPALLPGTEYGVWVLVGADSAIGRTEREPFTFTTAGRPYPRVVRTEVIERGTDRLKIRFRTNVPTKASLAWGATLDAVFRSERLATVHTFEIDRGLRPRATYAYTVVLEDAEGRKMTMPPAEVSTAEANAARGAAVTGTFTELTESMEPGPALARVTDGRLDYFEGMASSGDPSETDQWVRIDLGRPRVLEEVEVAWRAVACPKAFFVVVGETEGEMRYPGGPYDAEAGEVSRSERGDPIRHVRIDPGLAPVRFITVFVPKGSAYHVMFEGWKYVQLAEVKAHLRPGVDDRSASAQPTRAIGHGGVR